MIFESTNYDKILVNYDKILVKLGPASYYL